MKRLLVALTVCVAVLNLPAVHAAPLGVVTGKVVAPDGGPASEALVRVTALDPNPPSGQYQDPEVGTAIAGPDGRFAVPLVLNSTLESLAAFHDGALNLWVHASQPGAQPIADTAVAWVQNGGLLPPAPMSLALPALPAGTTVPLHHHGCMNYPPQHTVVERTEPFEPVGEVHTGRDTFAKFEYGKKANTNLSGAYKPQGSNWIAGYGVSHMGNTETAIGGEMGPHFGRVQMTQFRYRKDKIEWCERGLTCQTPCRTDYRVVAEQWKGISIIDGEDVSHLDGQERFNQRKDEGEFSPGKYWRKHQGQGKQYTKGVEAFGIGLHSQSEWSEWVDIYYRFGTEPFQHMLFSTEDEIEKAQTVYGW